MAQTCASLHLKLYKTVTSLPKLAKKEKIENYNNNILFQTYIKYQIQHMYDNISRKQLEYDI